MSGSVNFPDPELVAATLLEEAKQSQPPVNLEQVTRLWDGMEIAQDDIEGEGYIIDLGAFGVEIVVRAASKLTRQRYTVAHELGHWVLKVCADMPLHNVSSKYRTTVERWCDRFAAGLLMPRPWLLNQLNTTESGHLLRLISDGPEKYQVSEQAFYLRISEVASANIFEIREFRGRIKVAERYEGPQAPEWIAALTGENLAPLLIGRPQRLAKLASGQSCVFAWTLKRGNNAKPRWVVGAFPAVVFEEAVLKSLEADETLATKGDAVPFRKSRGSEKTIDYVKRAERHCNKPQE